MHTRAGFAKARGIRKRQARTIIQKKKHLVFGDEFHRGLVAAVHLGFVEGPDATADLYVALEGLHLEHELGVDPTLLHVALLHVEELVAQLDHLLVGPVRLLAELVPLPVELVAPPPRLGQVVLELLRPQH